MKPTARELEILKLLCCGLLIKEVADRLKISVRTVEVHRERVYRKIEVHDRMQALRWLYRNELITHKEWMEHK